MILSYYMDQHVPGPIVRGLRTRGINCLAAEEDGMKRAPDRQLLKRATALDRVLVSQDTDLLRIACHCLKQGIDFAGLVFMPQTGTAIGQAIHDLELLARVMEPEEMQNRIEYLPL